MQLSKSINDIMEQAGRRKIAIRKSRNVVLLFFLKCDPRAVIMMPMRCKTKPEGCWLSSVATAVWGPC